VFQHERQVTFTEYSAEKTLRSEMGFNRNKSLINFTRGGIQRSRAGTSSWERVGLNLFFFFFLEGSCIIQKLFFKMFIQASYLLMYHETEKAVYSMWLMGNVLQQKHNIYQDHISH